MRSLLTLLGACGAALCLIGPASAAGAPAVSGTFSTDGKTVKLTHGVAFVDQQAQDKPTLLLLADRPLPDRWTSEFDWVLFRSKTGISGVCFSLDKDRKVYRTDYYFGQHQAGVGGAFNLAIEGGDAKTLTGKASSEADFAKIKLEATFSVPVK